MTDATTTERLERIEAMLKALLDREAAKEWYTVEEFAELVGKNAYTVREWCRYGRVGARKTTTMRGRHPAWTISHDELLRYRRDGLLPLRAFTG